MAKKGRRSLATLGMTEGVGRRFLASLEMTKKGLEMTTFPLSFRACRRQARNLICYEWQIRRRSLAALGMSERGRKDRKDTKKRKEIPHFVRNDRTGSEGDFSLRSK
jgi:hypothetical protein